MATKQLYATGTFKYQNRMMKAGDPVEMDAPHARLYTALGKVTEFAPLKGKPTAIKNVKVVAHAERKAPTKKPAAKKATRKKPAAKK